MKVKAVFRLGMPDRIAFPCTVTQDGLGHRVVEIDDRNGKQLEGILIEHHAAGPIGVKIQTDCKPAPVARRWRQCQDYEQLLLRKMEK